MDVSVYFVKQGDGEEVGPFPDEALTHIGYHQAKEWAQQNGGGAILEYRFEFADSELIEEVEP